MFAADDRDAVRTRLIALAEADPGISGAAVIGSFAGSGGDRWSDIDLMLGVEGDLGAALERWTAVLVGEWGVVHHWDLPVGASVYRVFLLQNGLEVDLGFAPAAGFGPRGPAWRLLFGTPVVLEHARPADRDTLIGMAWHHVLHVSTCVERGRPWQALRWLNEARGKVFGLIDLRLGAPDGFTPKEDALPEEATAPLVGSIAGSLEPAELRRALAVVIGALDHEVELCDPSLAARLRLLLAAVA
ncbi:hypothetical protein Lfu02_61070 [Longispora fulva]|uniref:Nucleotidyltransferase domain-containing protein n=1 Tax=Longispora fulva TaxID=619741 RepID=A0A8J7GIA1_9ACTN|nr:hypothetical protein [Longispora fulva]MBG6136913.1 hypothetical protein [Longispora fulva]GIG61735.1 hypothetical protein Lfu02_61070 [Longispora fulva]